MNRADYQALADLHRIHAEALLNGGLFAGAYYMCGYAVECRLKACIAKLFRLTIDFEFPDQKKYGAEKGGGLNLYSHDLQFLVRAAGLFAGAYYMCGYAVECRLKACIAKLFRLTIDFEFPDQKKYGAEKGGGLNLYSHDLQFLVRAAGLSLVWAAKLDADPPFRRNWGIVKVWTPESRYQLGRTAQEAQDYYSAVADLNYGVLPCIRGSW